MKVTDKKFEFYVVEYNDKFHVVKKKEENYHVLHGGIPCRKEAIAKLDKEATAMFKRNRSEMRM